MPRDFNGSSDLAAHLAAGSIITGHVPLLFAARFKPDVVGTAHRTCLQLGTDSSSSICYRLRVDQSTGKMEFALRDDVGTNAQARIATTGPSTTAWNAAVGVAPAAHTLRCFLNFNGTRNANVNFQEVTGLNPTLGFAAGTFNRVVIGTLNSGGMFFDGKIADVVLGFGIAPTDAEIKRFCDGDLPTDIWPALLTSSPISSWWQLLGNESGTVPDMIGGRTLTLTGTAAAQNDQPEQLTAVAQYVAASGVMEDSGSDAAEHGDRIARVNDQRPRALHGLQATAADKPRFEIDVRSRASMVFDKLLDGSTFDQNAANGRFIDLPVCLPVDRHTVFIVAEVNDLSMGDSASSQLPVKNMWRPAAGNGGLLGVSHTWPTTHARLVTHDGTTGVVSGVRPVSSLAVYVLRWNGLAWKVWRNLVSSNGAAGSVTANYSGAGRFGCASTDANGLLGRIREVLPFNRALSDAEVEAQILALASAHAVPVTPRLRLMVDGTSTYWGQASGRVRPAWRRLDEMGLLSGVEVRSYATPGSRFSLATYGHNAYRSELIAAALEAPFVPGVHLLQYGSNDIRNGDSAATVLAAIESACTDIRSAYNGAGRPQPSIVVQTMHYREDCTAGQETQRATLNGLLRAGINKGTTFDAVVSVDQITGLNGDDPTFALYDPAEIPSQRKHLNDTGHDLNATLLAQVLGPYLSAGGGSGGSTADVATLIAMGVLGS